MKLGAHCVLYGPKIATDTDTVMKQLADAGAEGCELGQRFFSTDRQDDLMSVLHAERMSLAGMHVASVTLTDLLHRPEQAKAVMEQAAKFVSVFPYKNIIVTGGVPSMEELRDCTLAEGVPDPELHIPENAKTMAVHLDEIAGSLYDTYGVQVHYHNHSWEFADEGMIWFAIARYAPKVNFALDTGWAAVSGFDPVSLMERYPGRFHYVHLRDYKKGKAPQEMKFHQAHTGYVSLGSGDMNYPRLMRQLNRTLDKDDWVIVEYELGNFDQTSYSKALSYLSGIRDMLEERGE